MSIWVVVFDGDAVDLIFELLRPYKLGLSVWFYKEYLILEYVKVIDGFMDILWCADYFMDCLVVVLVSFY